MSPQLMEYADAHRQSQAEAHRIADSLSDDQFNWKPAADSWSVAECLAHLNVVAEAYLPHLEAAVTDSTRRGTGPFEYGFMARKMTDGVRPGGPALRTGAALNPSVGGSESSLRRDEILTAFDGYAARYVAVCEQADELDLARIKVRYPFMRLLRLPLGAFLDITGLHALRHTQQAGQLIEQPDFPN